MTVTTHGGARPGAGRPKGIPNKHHAPKTRPTWIRFSEEERAKLQKKAEALEISLSEYVRRAALKTL